MSEDEVLKLQEKSSNRQWKSFAIKWKNLQIQNLDPDPKFDSIKIFTQKNVKKFDL